MKNKQINAQTDRSKLADLYEVDISVIQKWLDKLGIHHSKKLKPLELAICVSNWGPPSKDTIIDLPMDMVPEDLIAPVDALFLYDFDDDLDIAFNTDF